MNKKEEARLYTVAAFLLGNVLIDELTSTEQNALGNWLMLVAQICYFCNSFFCKIN